ncbi:hypothetical protein XA68_18329 [Ophiocordyceps unilateralis]|uniref:Uncharacterized protein n=1 Tax=Ophiocordyceps unilateralis TaxID=268505 RepID=A0A2A9PI99_OPHUN|nr:hypothetical protein XA68_18329 [Ophiocordyceps unilateralis]
MKRSASQKNRHLASTYLSSAPKGVASCSLPFKTAAAETEVQGTEQTARVGRPAAAVMPDAAGASDNAEQACGPGRVVVGQADIDEAAGQAERIVQKPLMNGNQAEEDC